MKKTLLWIAFILVALIVLVSGVITFMQYRTYEAPYPAINASKDTALIARGKYLVTGPGHCADCHAPENMYQQVEAGQLVSMKGGRVFNMPFGVIQAPNITQDKETGIGAFTDAEIARSLRHGVGKDGRSLFPLMPFQNLSDYDLQAIISYLRTLPAEKNAIKTQRFNVLGYALNAFAFRPAGPQGTPLQTISIDSTAEYGAYLANNVANCKGCHTNRDLTTGAFVGENYAGGFHMESMKDPKNFQCVTPNLTPDPVTGRIANWSEQRFIERFRAGKLNPHSPMPWGPLKNMSELELKAIYRYLQTLKPVNHNTGETLVRLQ